jgi:hypothetical protein
MKNEIILYRPDELSEHIEVRLDEETVWLNRQQIASLFGRDIKTIGKHINTIFTEGELLKESTVANFATVQMDWYKSIKVNFCHSVPTLRDISESINTANDYFKKLKRVQFDKNKKISHIGIKKEDY